MSIEFMSNLVQLHARLWWAVTNGFVSGWFCSLVFNSLWFPASFLYVFCIHFFCLVCADAWMEQMSQSVIAKSDKGILLSWRWFDIFCSLTWWLCSRYTEHRLSYHACCVLSRFCLFPPMSHSLILQLLSTHRACSHIFWPHCDVTYEPNPTLPH